MALYGSIGVTNQNTISPMDDTTGKDALERLKAWMHRDRYNGSQLAAHLGITKQQVYRWLNGTQAMPLKRIEQSATLFGASPAELLYGIGESQIRPDGDVLAKVITAVSTTAQQKSVDLTPAQLAKIVMMIYAREQFENGLLKETASELVDLIAA
tara:strand:- start:24 stop:488 length:465 start_codon:yes stop_codon:yes gene_type:complete